MKRIIFGTTDSIIADKNHPKLKFVNIHLFLLFPSCCISLLVLKFIDLIRNSRKEIFRTVNKIFETLFIPRVEITHFYIRVSELFKTPSLTYLRGNRNLISLKLAISHIIFQSCCSKHYANLMLWITARHYFEKAFELNRYPCLQLWAALKK